MEAPSALFEVLNDVLDEAQVSDIAESAQVSDIAETDQVSDIAEIAPDRRRSSVPAEASGEPRHFLIHCESGMALSKEGTGHCPPDLISLEGGFVETQANSWKIEEHSGNQIVLRNDKHPQRAITANDDESFMLVWAPVWTSKSVWVQEIKEREPGKIKVTLRNLCADKYLALESAAGGFRLTLSEEPDLWEIRQMHWRAFSCPGISSQGFNLGLRAAFAAAAAL